MMEDAELGEAVAINQRTRPIGEGRSLASPAWRGQDETSQPPLFPMATFRR